MSTENTVVNEPYSIKALAATLKTKGVDLAESAVIEVIKGVSQWAQESAKAGTKPMVDAGVLLVAPQAEKFLVEMADKIDGVKG